MNIKTTHASIARKHVGCRQEYDILGGCHSVQVAVSTRSTLGPMQVHHIVRGSRLYTMDILNILIVGPQNAGRKANPWLPPLVFQRCLLLKEYYYCVEARSSYIRTNVFASQKKLTCVLVYFKLAESSHLTLVGCCNTQLRNGPAFSRKSIC